MQLAFVPMFNENMEFKDQKPILSKKSSEFASTIITLMSILTIVTTIFGITFSQSIVFDKCTFEENVVFAAPWSKPDSVSAQFEQDCIFNSSTFKGQARFRNATFRGTAGFDGCTVDGVVTFKNATFKKDAKFRTVAFNGYSLFGIGR